MKLEDLMLSEINQTQNENHYMFLLIHENWGKKKSRLDVVVTICNLSYAGVREWEV
jgi:hypothetical protein